MKKTTGYVTLKYPNEIVIPPNFQGCGYDLYWRETGAETDIMTYTAALSKPSTAAA
ncbi:MAG: hypothetical protein GY765_06815 [bacterium]|nr:hypothetical protein [bacterium]